MARGIGANDRPGKRYGLANYLRNGDGWLPAASPETMPANGVPNKMPRRLLILARLCGALLLAGTQSAHAQVPDHPPGSICSTPSGWCWAMVSGPVGAACTCPTGGGLAAGTLI